MLTRQEASRHRALCRIRGKGNRAAGPDVVAASSKVQVRWLVDRQMIEVHPEWSGCYTMTTKGEDYLGYLDRHDH